MGRAHRVQGLNHDLDGHGRGQHDLLRRQTRERRPQVKAVDTGLRAAESLAGKAHLLEEEDRGVLEAADLPGSLDERFAVCGIGGFGGEELEGDVARAILLGAVEVGDLARLDLRSELIAVAHRPAGRRRHGTVPHPGGKTHRAFAPPRSASYSPGQRAELALMARIIGSTEGAPAPVPAPANALSTPIGRLVEPEVLQILERQPRREVKRARQVFVNRNLRMDKVAVVGFDMDYTLAIYHKRRIEQLSYDMTLVKLVNERGYPPPSARSNTTRPS